MFTEEWLSDLLSKGEHSVISSVSLKLQLPEEIQQQLKQKHSTQAHASSKRNGKYNATRKEVDGISFHSAGEATRYSNLKYQASLGIITHADKWLQVSFVVQSEAIDTFGVKIKPVTYIADFVYTVGGVTVAEDYKGFITNEFHAKRRKFIERYPNIYLWVNTDKQAVFRPELISFYDQQYIERRRGKKNR